MPRHNSDCDQVLAGWVTGADWHDRMGCVPRPAPTLVLHMTRIERIPSVIRHGLLPDNAVLQRAIRLTHIVGERTEPPAMTDEAGSQR